MQVLVPDELRGRVGAIKRSSRHIHELGGFPLGAVARDRLRHGSCLGGIEA